MFTPSTIPMIIKLSWRKKHAHPQYFSYRFMFTCVKENPLGSGTLTIWLQTGQECASCGTLKAPSGWHLDKKLTQKIICIGMGGLLFWELDNVWSIYWKDNWIFIHLLLFLRERNWRVFTVIRSQRAILTLVENLKWENGAFLSLFIEIYMVWSTSYFHQSPPALPAKNPCSSSSDLCPRSNQSTREAQPACKKSSTMKSKKTIAINIKGLSKI